MPNILDPTGAVVQRSRNLAGIRRYVGKNLIDVMDITRVGDGEGKLSIKFDNGNTFETTFGDYGVLRDFVRRWRNVYGAPLNMNSFHSGVVQPDNPHLWADAVFCDGTTDNYFVRVYSDKAKDVFDAEYSKGHQRRKWDGFRYSSEVPAGPTSRHAMKAFLLKHGLTFADA